MRAPPVPGLLTCQPRGEHALGHSDPVLWHLGPVTCGPPSFHGEADVRGPTGRELMDAQDCGGGSGQEGTETGQRLHDLQPRPWDATVGPGVQDYHSGHSRLRGTGGSCLVRPRAWRLPSGPLCQASGPELQTNCPSHRHCPCTGFLGRLRPRATVLHLGTPLASPSPWL